MSRISRDSSEALDDDRLSLASSDNSSSHRLNDVGDVQNLARLQEESKSFFPLSIHMWLMGCPNPYMMQESWECTFLKVFTHIETK